MYLFELEKIYEKTIEKLSFSLIKEIDDVSIINILTSDNIPDIYRDSLVEIAILKTFGNPKSHN